MNADRPSPYDPEPQIRDPHQRADPRLGTTARQAAPPTAGPRLQRQRRVENPLYFPPRIVPAHMSYEWKRDSLLGRPDNDHMIGLRENHWHPVPADRHPELAHPGATVIRRGDVILCERPRYLTDEARMEDLQEALGPVENINEVIFGTKPDQMTRDHPSVRRVSRADRRYAPGEVPSGQAPEDGSWSEP